MKSNLRNSLKAALALLLAFGLTTPVLAQSVSATITGTVQDKSGAVLKDASVTAVNQKTQVEYPTKSNNSGIYTIQGLPLGTYTIKAEAAGMKSLQTNPITLEVGQTARVNLPLEVGAKTEEIEVVGVNPTLQTENATVGEVVTGSTIVALPLNGRNFAQLALLSPGVQTHSPDTFNSPKQSADSGRPYINGQREQSNNYMLDGIDQNEAVDNLIAYYPSPDAIAEMRIETNNYSAEFGNVAGGVISAITKSGTNEFHGSAFSFARNDKFDANSWGNNRSGAKKADLSQNIFGATLSGPLVKNKLFFFADYQGQTTDRPGDATATVATASQRDGSAYGIPASAINPIAARILNDTVNYPLPTNGLPTGNYVHTANRTTRNHQGDIKLDANFGPNDNVFVRASLGSFDTHQEEAVFPLAYGNAFLSDTTSVAANWTHSLSPTTVNELRVGYSHVKNTDNPADPGNTGNYAESIGLPMQQNIAGLPTFNIPGLDAGTGGPAFGTNGVGHDGIGNTYQISEKLSFSKGRHYVSVGGQFIHYNMNQLYSTNTGLLGFMNFNSFQDFLLGNAAAKGTLVSATAGAGVPAWTQLQNRMGLFIQDDFKPTSNLTLNIGLRWEYASPITEENDRQVNFDINTGAPILPGGAFGDALYESYKGGFSPRLGLAYTLNPKTVVRAGFGLVQYQEGTGANCRLPINPPFEAEARGGPGSLSSGFLELGTAADQIPATLQLRAWQTDMRPQLTKQWNFFVERQITDSTSLNVGYVGSRSSHVITFNDKNAPLSNVSNAVGPRRIPSLGFLRYTASDGKMSYNGLQASLRHRMAHGLEFLASYTFSRALADNQGFYGPGWGSRAANQITAGQLGDGNYDPYNFSLDYGPQWFSSDHNFTFSTNYQLPIGKGRSVGGDWSGVTQALLGGWNVSGILSVRSGLPITVVDGWGGGGPSNNTGFSFERPNLTGADLLTGASSEDLKTGASYLNPAAFVANTTPGTHGNSGVGVARGPGFYNLDAGIDKNFDLGGTRYLTIRVEAFNVLNHTNLGLPYRSLAGTGGPFGTIGETANSARVLELAAKFVF